MLRVRENIYTIVMIIVVITMMCLLSFTDSLPFDNDELKPFHSSSIYKNSNKGQKKHSPAIIDTMMNKKPIDNKLPENLIGLFGEDAKTSIMKERPDLTNIQVLPVGSMVTRDFRLDRVRIFVDKDNKVVQNPRVG